MQIFSRETAVPQKYSDGHEQWSASFTALIHRDPFLLEKDTEAWTSLAACSPYYSQSQKLWFSGQWCQTFILIAAVPAKHPTTAFLHPPAMPSCLAQLCNRNSSCQCLQGHFSRSWFVQMQYFQLVTCLSKGRGKAWGVEPSFPVT